MSLPLVFLLYALFASIFTIGKTSLEYAQPFFIVGSRMFIAGLLMLVYQFFKDRQAFKFDRSVLIGLLLIAVFNIYLTNVCEFWGLQHLFSSKACLLYSISPFISAFLSYIVLSERMNIRKWIGLFLGFGAILPILMIHSQEEESVGSFFFMSWPGMAVVAAATFSVYGWILIRKLVSRKQIGFIMINGFSMAVGGLITLGHSGIVETWDPIPVYDFWPFVWTALAMMVISNGICYNLYGFLLKRYTATFMSFAGLSTSIFAILFGWLFLNETTPWQFWACLVVVFISLYIFHKEEIKQHALLQKG